MANLMLVMNMRALTLPTSKLTSSPPSVATVPGVMARRSTSRVPMTWAASGTVWASASRNTRPRPRTRYPRASAVSGVDRREQYQPVPGARHALAGEPHYLIPPAERRRTTADELRSSPRACWAGRRPVIEMLRQIEAASAKTVRDSCSTRLVTSQ